MTNKSDFIHHNCARFELEMTSFKKMSSLLSAAAKASTRSVKRTYSLLFFVLTCLNFFLSDISLITESLKENLLVLKLVKPHSMYMLSEFAKKCTSTATFYNFLNTRPFLPPVCFPSSTVSMPFTSTNKKPVLY